MRERLEGLAGSIYGTSSVRLPGITSGVSSLNGPQALFGIGSGAQVTVNNSYAFLRLETKLSSFERRIERPACKLEFHLHSPWFDEANPQQLPV